MIIQGVAQLRVLRAMRLAAPLLLLALSGCVTAYRPAVSEMRPSYDTDLKACQAYAYDYAKHNTKVAFVPAADLFIGAGGAGSLAGMERSIDRCMRGRGYVVQ